MIKAFEFAGLKTEKDDEDDSFDDCPERFTMEFSSEFHQLEQFRFGCSTHSLHLTVKDAVWQLRMIRKLATTLSTHLGLTETLLACKKVKLFKWELRLATDLIELLSHEEEATQMLQKRHEENGLLLPA
ncbi:hypothetical protein MRX96_017479 [Rhipicephalus microplus]